MLAASENVMRVLRLMDDGQERTLADIARETGLRGMPLDYGVHTLVRNSHLSRIHNTDGVLRYRAKEGTRWPKAARQRTYPNTAFQSVLAALRDADRPLITDDFLAITNVSRASISVALSLLRDEGTVEQVRRGNRCAWRLTA